MDNKINFAGCVGGGGAHGWAGAAETQEAKIHEEFSTSYPQKYFVIIKEHTRMSILSVPRCPNKSP